MIYKMAKKSYKSKRHQSKKRHSKKRSMKKRSVKRSHGRGWRRSPRHEIEIYTEKCVSYFEKKQRDKLIGTESEARQKKDCCDKSPNDIACKGER
jgi:hypothetical protein